MTPFWLSVGGGFHVTTKDVVEVLVTLMLVGGASGAVNRKIVFTRV